VNPLTVQTVKPGDDAAASRRTTCGRYTLNSGWVTSHTGEIDITPALCLGFLLGTFALMVGTGL
jgi:hypothetical protein